MNVRQFAIGLIILLGILIGLRALILSSVPKDVSAEIWIDAPPNEVYTALGNDSLSSEWSVYVSHIKTLSDESNGAKIIRRCYRGADESGPYWDEETQVEIEGKQRLLKAYNFQQLNIEMLNLSMIVEQNYTASKGGTLLEFKTYPIKESLLLGVILSNEAKETKEIFKKNLENIKALLENGGSYKRIHPFSIEE